MKNQTQLTAEQGKQEYFITRDFDAPLELVFKAFSTPELLVQWFLPREANPKIEIMECKTGGNFILTHNGPNGMTFGFKGVYHEVISDESIVKTSEFFGLPQKLDPVLEFIRLEELSSDKTRVTIHTICPSVDYRDNMIAANMEPTLKVTHAQLDELLNSLKNGKLAV